MAMAAKRASQVVTHIGIGFGVAACLSGSALLGGVAMLIEPLINVALLPFHEHAWAALRSRARSVRGRYAAVAAEKLSQTLLHACTAFAVMFAFTGSMVVGGIVALVEPVCNVLVLPLHDRMWDRLYEKLCGRPCVKWQLPPAVE